MKTIKICHACYTQKPIKCFKRHGRSLDKHFRVCKDCQKVGLDIPENPKKKVCGHCETIKRPSTFAKDKYQRDGYHPVCNVCRRKQSREYHQRKGIAERRKKYYRDRRPYFAAQRANRQAKKRGITDEITKEDVLSLLWASGGKCKYCGIDTKNDFTLEHMTPLSRDGDNTIGNIAICCAPCNTAKLDRTLEEFIVWIKVVYKHMIEQHNGSSL